MSAKDSKDSARTPEEIRAEIEATRADLADAMTALSARFDVKAQARDKVAGVTARLKSPPVYVGAAVAASGLAARVIQRKLTSRKA